MHSLPLLDNPDLCATHESVEAMDHARAHARLMHMPGGALARACAAIFAGTPAGELGLRVPLLDEGVRRVKVVEPLCGEARLYQVSVETGGDELLHNGELDAVARPRVGAGRPAALVEPGVAEQRHQRRAVLWRAHEQRAEEHVARAFGDVWRQLAARELDDPSHERLEEEVVVEVVVEEVVEVQVVVPPVL